MTRPPPQPTITMTTMTTVRRAAGPLAVLSPAAVPGGMTGAARVSGRSGGFTVRRAETPRVFHPASCAVAGPGASVMEMVLPGRRRSPPRTPEGRR